MIILGACILSGWKGGATWISASLEKVWGECNFGCLNRKRFQNRKMVLKKVSSLKYRLDMQHEREGRAIHHD